MATESRATEERSTDDRATESKADSPYAHVETPGTARSCRGSERSAMYASTKPSIYIDIQGVRQTFLFKVLQ